MTPPGALLCPGHSLLSCRFVTMVALLCPSPFPRRSGWSALSLGMGLRAPSFLLFPFLCFSSSPGVFCMVPKAYKALSCLCKQGRAPPFFDLLATTTCTQSVPGAWVSIPDSLSFPDLGSGPPFTHPRKNLAGVGTGRRIHEQNGAGELGPGQRGSLVCEKACTAA